MDAATLCAQVRRDLHNVERRIRDNPWLAGLEAGRLPVAALRAFAGEQLHVIGSDERSFSGLVQRCPTDPAHEYLNGMAAGERAALTALEAFAAAVGVRAEGQPEYEPIPGCQAYPSFVARLARDGTAAEVAGAFLVNLTAWGSACARMYVALGRHYHLSETDRAFFAHFAGPTAELERISLAVIDHGLAEGLRPTLVARAARLLQAYELQFWQSLPS